MFLSNTLSTWETNLRQKTGVFLRGKLLKHSTAEALQKPSICLPDFPQVSKARSTLYLTTYPCDLIWMYVGCLLQCIFDLTSEHSPSVSSVCSAFIHCCLIHNLSFCKARLLSVLSQDICTLSLFPQRSSPKSFMAASFHHFHPSHLKSKTITSK